MIANILEPMRFLETHGLSKSKIPAAPWGREEDHRRVTYGK